MSGKTVLRRIAVMAAIMSTTLFFAQSANATTTYGSAALAVARTKLGDPYIPRAAGPNSFDCSGLSQYSYEHSKVHHYLPRTAEGQYKYLRKISHANRKPGDLVFFHSSSGYVFHVGIYVGVHYHWGAYRSYMIHAPKSGSHVKFEDIYENWGYSYVTYGRV